MWPGCTRSSDLALRATAACTVRARSAAEMPVVTPSAASIETVKAVPFLSPLRATMGGRLQVLAAVARERQADQAAAEAGHEVDRLGRDVVGGEHQVAFVLAVFLVDQDDHAAGAHVGDDVFDRRDGHRRIDGWRGASCAGFRGRGWGREHALDIAGDQVDFQVDPAARLQRAQRRVLHGVRDQVDADLAAFGRVGDAVDGEADAVDGDRALVGQVLAQRARARARAAPSFRRPARNASRPPMPSTWPDTMWPPSRSWARRAFSRLMGPGAARPAVLSRDSAEMSMEKRAWAGSSAVTVMQAPLSAMLSPRPTSSR